MTEMRDARFKRALQAAPDAQLGPQEATRRAVRDAAGRAVQPRETRHWWASWLSSRQHMPWNAAFATVLLASLVGLLWQGRDLPVARTDSTRADVASPTAPVSAPAPAPAPAPAGSSPAPAPAAPQSQAAPRVAPAPPQRMSEAKPAKRAEVAGQDSEARSVRERLEKSAPQDLARQREATAPLQDNTAARAPASEGGTAPPSASDAAAPAAPTPSPPPAPAPAPAVAAAPRAAPAAELSARSPAAPGWQQWSQLRIEKDGQVLTVSRERASHLAGLIEQAAASATTQEPLAEAPQWKLELRRDGRPLGVLEVAGVQLRWTVPGAGARTGRPEPAVLLALREELQRLLPR